VPAALIFLPFTLTMQALALNELLVEFELAITSLVLLS